MAVSLRNRDRRFVTTNLSVGQSEVKGRRSIQRSGSVNWCHETNREDGEIGEPRNPPKAFNVFPLTAAGSNGSGLDFIGHGMRARKSTSTEGSHGCGIVPPNASSSLGELTPRY